MSDTLDRYRQGWEATHRSACEATRVQGHQSEDVLDRRMQCLDEERAQMGALMDIFTHADAGVVGSAVEAVYALPPVTRCSAEVTRASRLKLPDDPAVRREVASVRARLARARATLDAGRYEEALSLAQSLEAEVEQTEYLPLEAEWLRQVGDAYNALRRIDEARTAYEAALMSATAAEHDLVAAQALGSLGWVVGILQSHYVEATPFVRYGKAVAGRVGDPQTRSELLYYDGRLLHELGEPAAARKAMQQALDLAVRAHGPDHVDTARIWTQLGLLERTEGRYEEGRVATEKAVAIETKARGPDHPDNASSMVALARLYGWDLDSPDRARELLERALALQESRGPGTPDAAITLALLALLATDHDRYDEAEVWISRAKAAFDASVGWESQHSGAAWLALGRLQEARGDYDAAYETFA